MQIQPLTYSDFEYLHEFEPPGWGDLVPRFKYCIDTGFCDPIKLISAGKTVAIGTTILHKDSAWLASIIVHPNERNQGYGKIITKQLVDSIDQNKYTTIYLDATDLGYPVYEKLGFEVEAQYAHLKAVENITGLTWSENIVPYSNKYLAEILQLDKFISCEDRKDVLLENINTSQLYINNNKLEGFYMPSLGNGLIIANNDIVGIELATCRLENNYYAILPDANKVAIHFLQDHKLVHFRNSRRMYIGKKRAWQAKHIYNRISGQLG